MATIPKTITIDNLEIAIQTQRLRRARRLSMRILEKERAIKLTLPWHCSYAVALEFLLERKAWISNHLHLLEPAANFHHGMEIPIHGIPHTITHAPEKKRGVRLDGTNLFVSGFNEHIPRRVGDYLKKHMRTYCTVKADEYAKLLGVRHKLNRIAIRDTSSRWGSCSHNGTVSICWRLVFAPQEVLDYVIAHEISHLAEMNHSPAFWQHVKSITPHFQHHKNWLKSNGYKLWNYHLKTS